MTGENEEYGTRELPSTSHVSAEVSSFAIFGGPSLDAEPRLRVGTVRAELTSYCRADRPEPEFSLGRSGVTAVFVDGWEFIVEVHTQLFSTANSYVNLGTHHLRIKRSHISDAIRPHTDDSVSLLAGQLDLVRFRPEVGANYHKEVPKFATPFYGSIVKSITRGEGQSNRPRPEINGHTIVAEDFGTIFFGEIVLSKHWRELTMMRLELGSGVGGEVGISSVSKNGTWVP